MTTELDLSVQHTDVEHILRGIYHRRRRASVGAYEPSPDTVASSVPPPPFENLDLPPELYSQLDYAARIYDPRSVPGNTRFYWLKKLFMRLLRLYTTRQVEFNATVMRVLDVITDKLGDVVKIFQYFRDAEVRLTQRLERAEQIAAALNERLDAHRARIEELEAYERELFAQRARIEALEAYERELFAQRKRIEALEAYERELFAQRTRIEALEAYERELFAQRTRIEALEAYERELFAQRARIEALEAYERELFAQRTRIEALEAYERELFAQRARIEALEAYEREIFSQRKRFEALEEVDRTTDRRIRVLEDLRNRLEYSLSETAVLRQRLDSILMRFRQKAWLVPTDSVNKPTQVEAGLTDVSNDHLYFPYLNLDRGTEKEIRERMERYLKVFQSDSKASHKERKLVVDIGCGRGEFLEACVAAGIPCCGVDVNEDMVAYCRGKQLDVVHARANEYLKSVEDESLRGIVSCQVIEHLQPGELLEFVRLSVAKVMRGGHIIIETPNPTSVFALQMFYRDFTHVRPIHPDTLQFLYRQLGVNQTELQWLSPTPPEHLLKLCKQNCIDTALERLNSLLFGYLDYALIITK